MHSIVLQSPAKLNLYLKVLNKRTDGYHNIVTLFERINLFDEICLKSNQNGSVRIYCDNPHVPRGPKNLVYKVARVIQDDLGINKGVDIRIKKRIPVAAGLGGGSSNAATVLKGLNKIWNLNLSRHALLSYANFIGSDVAFFLVDSPWALGRRRGDQVKRLSIKTQLFHILVVPRVKMYSGQVYSGLKLSLKHAIMPSAEHLKSSPRESLRKKASYTNMLTRTNDNVNIFIRSLKTGDIGKVSQLLTNDLETEVIRIYPQLLKLKQRLKSLSTIGVMISGSGPSVFGLTRTEEEAKFIKSILLRRFTQVYVVRTF
jgi:4-diphosphocytidyl-2-C-methyl-D-erythritol kinase